MRVGPSTPEPRQLRPGCGVAAGEHGRLAEPERCVLATDAHRDAVLVDLHLAEQLEQDAPAPRSPRAPGRCCPVKSSRCAPGSRRRPSPAVLPVRRRPAPIRLRATGSTSALARSGGDGAGELRSARRRHRRAPCRPSAALSRAAQFGEAVVVAVSCAHVDDALLDPAGVGDQHRHAGGWAPSGTSSMCRTRARPTEGYCTSATWLVSWDSSRTVRASTSSRSTDCAEERLDRLALRRRQRAQVGEVVDEDPVALVGGDAAGGGVRRGDQLLLFEQRHVVADRRRRHAERVAVDDATSSRPARGMPRSPAR